MKVEQRMYKDMYKENGKIDIKKKNADKKKYTSMIETYVKSELDIEELHRLDKGNGFLFAEITDAPDGLKREYHAEINVIIKERIIEE